MVRLDRKGTNLLMVEAADDYSTGRPVTLPRNAVAMVERIGPVRHATATANVDARIRHSDVVPEKRTAGVTTQAAGLDEATYGFARAQGWTAVVPTLVPGGRPYGQAPDRRRRASIRRSAPHDCTRGWRCMRCDQPWRHRSPVRCR